MTIYIDDSIWPYRGQLYCHMMTDSDNLDELHQFAKKTNLRRAWFQDDPRHPHYDLAPSKRAAAKLVGAVEIDGVDMVRLCVRRRDNG